MNCTYTSAAGSTHSTQIGVGEDSAATKLYGKWEDFSTSTLPALDACGGHFGTTPDSPSTTVYHNHVQEHPPFTFGCYGPNSAGGLVTLAQCKALYTGSNGCGTDSSSVESVVTDQGTINYDAWCPCFDGSGNGYGGGGLNTYDATIENCAVAGTCNTNGSTTPSTTPDEGGGFSTGAVIGVVGGGTAALLLLVGGFLALGRGSGKSGAPMIEMKNERA